MKGKIRALATSGKYLVFNKKAALRSVELFGSGDLGFLKVCSSPFLLFFFSLLLHYLFPLSFIYQAFWELQETVSFVELDTAIRTPKPAVNSGAPFSLISPLYLLIGLPLFSPFSLSFLSEKI